MNELQRIGQAMRFLGIKYNLFQMIKRVADIEQAKEVEEDFKAVVKARRRELAKKYHPDKGGDLEAMKQINKVCDYLMSVTVEYAPRQPRHMPQFVFHYSFGFSYEDPSTTSNTYTMYTGS